MVLGEDQYRISLSLSDNEGGEERQIFENQSMSVSWQQDSVSIELEGRMGVQSFYQSGDLSMNVFDPKGTCYKSVNMLDQIEREYEEKVDTERISAPMSGMVVKLNVEEGQTVKKVRDA